MRFRTTFSQIHLINSFVAPCANQFPFFVLNHEERNTNGLKTVTKKGKWSWDGLPSLLALKPSTCSLSRLVTFGFVVSQRLIWGHAANKLNSTRRQSYYHKSKPENHRYLKLRLRNCVSNIALTHKLVCLISISFRLQAGTNQRKKREKNGLQSATTLKPEPASWVTKFTEVYK